MANLEELRNERLKKLELLRKKGINPYPASSGRTVRIGTLIDEFDKHLEGEEVTVAGRVMSIREHGGSTFVDIYDGTGVPAPDTTDRQAGRIQGFLEEKTLGKKYVLFGEVVDIGDFIDMTGTPFTTKRGEKTIKATDWRMLTKTLLPLPEKWHGLQDTEERLRKRYLDILFSPELKEMLAQKARFWNVIRAFLKDRGFLEVETPTLELTTGGAEARPFRTHHNDFDLDVFLRISVGELWQKRLMAAGIPATFEIGRAYRNEGSSPEHVQEFTNMEFYAAFMDFEQGKMLVQELYRSVAQEVFGTTTFTTRGHTFDFGDDWREIDYVSTVEEKTGVNVLSASEDEMQNKLKELGVEFAGKNRERMTDALWKHCRKEVSGPAFLVNHPRLVAPLSKAHPDNPELTKTFQVLLAGSEVGRAHAELNDPLDQRARFEEQQKMIEAGDEEAMMPEWDYVEAMEYGMPPTFGFGVGDRLFSFMVDKPIRETQIFPLLKPKQQ